MLNKNEIIKEFKNEDFMVRNSIYEYVCNLHLYDDNEINEALIEFIENNYKEINFVGLVFSKLNVKIIECLIKIHLKEDDDNIKKRINDILVNHYSIIKNLSYNFEEIITDEGNSLLYKKIKHFSKKDAEYLIKLYMNNVHQYYLSDEDTVTTEILRKAIGIALIQSEEGYACLNMYAIALMMRINEEKGDIAEFLDEHMPYLVHPLCQKASPDNYAMILGLYFQNIDFLEYADECNYYFSTICNDEFIKFYIKSLNDIRKDEKEDYDYDIAEYLNSDKIDKFLIEEMKSNKDKSIKENIMCILARKFIKEAIPYILNYIQDGKAEDEYAIEDAIYPLLILEKKDDEVSKKIIEDVKKYEAFHNSDNSKAIADFLNDFQNFRLKDKQHIKDYKKFRKLHDEIMEDMMKYYSKGKFKFKVEEPQNQKGHANDIYFINSKFDTSTELGIQAMANVLVYKNAVNIKCVTEEFIENKKYTDEEKIELLDSMLNSEAGLFEITETDMKQGQVHLKDVLNGKEYCMTDIGFSSNLHNDKIYLYTRIITYNGISFGTGLNLLFYKDDDFICKWIEENKKEYNKKQEITRFVELYNKYQNNDNGIRCVSKNF